MKLKLSFALIALITLFCSCNKKQPEAYITSDKSVAETGDEIYFKNETTDGARFSWDFGDGTTSTEKNPIKAYEKPGPYQVSMTAFSEDKEKSDMATMNLNIKSANLKFIGFYDGEGCDRERGIIQISPGPTANDILIDFGDMKIEASVAGQAIILARREFNSPAGKYAVSGSGSISGDKINLLFKIDLSWEGNWYSEFCGVTMDKKQ
jgi:PKD repeat protein